MAELTRLQMETREGSGTNATRRLRKSGNVPAVLYGHGQGTVALATAQKELESGLAHSQFFELDVSGKIEPAIAREVQYDTYGQHILHVDFVRVDLDEKVTLSVPLKLRGIPVGLSKGGVQQTHVNSVTISVAARNAPETITLTISELAVGDSLTLGDVEIPEGGELADDPEKVVVMIAAKQADEDDEAEGDGEAPSEPEVVGKKSDDEEPSEG